jgi:hypothetical protein
MARWRKSKTGGNSFKDIIVEKKKRRWKRNKLAPEENKIQPKEEKKEEW